MTGDPLFLVVVVAVLAVLLILIVGVAQFGIGTVEAAKRSNRMMQLRIAAQFVAVILVVLFVYLRGGR